MPTTTLKVYETRTLAMQTGFSGPLTVPFQVTSGSRMLVTLLVSAIDPSTTVTLFIDNSFASDIAFDTIDSTSLNAVGRVKRIYSDFHNQFNFRIVVAGGNADFAVAVTVFDNAGTTKIENAQLSVNLDHTTDSLGHFDSVRIGDGTDLLDINSDGSLNVVVGEAPDESVIQAYNEVSAVPNGVDTDLLTYTVPPAKTAFLVRLDVSGENLARFDVYVNNVRIARKRIYYGGNLNETFDFSSSPKRGVELQAGDIVKVKVFHVRPIAGGFEARLQTVLKG